MQRCWRYVLLFLFISLFFYHSGACQPGCPQIYYDLTIKEGDWQTFYVNITIARPPHNRVVFVMPSWSPGGYMLGEYSKYVRHVQAKDADGKQLTTLQVNPSAWEVSLPTAKTMCFSYELKVSPRGFMGRSLTETYARINGPSTYMYLKGAKEKPVTVTFHLPTGWKIAIGLEEFKLPNSYWAPNYDIFVDAPALLGKFKQFQFDVAGVPHIVTITGETNFDQQKFVETVKRIVTYETQQLFNDIPYSKYVFMFNIYPGERGGGGLEHLNSTTIGLAGEKLKVDPTSGANVTAHEFFHLWNVKRIRPKVLGPFDYTKDVRTTALWFCEGVTCYYADLTCLRTGIWSVEKFWQNQAKQIAQHQEAYDRLQTSVEMASWKIWETGYGSAGVSFYTKGQILALLLDLQIREVTDNRRSLDDVIRFLNCWFAKYDEGYEERDLLRAVNSITNSDFSQFFDRYVSGTVEIPYADFLQHAGLKLRLESKKVPDIGRLVIMGPKNRVFNVEKGSPVDEVGIKRGDYLLSIDGQTVSSREDIARVVNSKEEGQSVAIEILRGDNKLNFVVPVRLKDKVNCRIDQVARPTEKQQRIYQGLIAGTTD